MSTCTSQEDMERGRTRREIIYEEKNWEEYIKYKKEKFEELLTQDNMDCSIVIRHIPGENEFYRLMDILKDEYGSRFTNFLIVDTGLTRFYYLCESSGLFDIARTIRLVDEKFHFENWKNFKIGIVPSIPKENMSSEFLWLNMNDDVRSIIWKISKDMNISQSDIGMIFCILTFNRAKKKFEEFIKDDFETYYDDNGYYRSIKDGINNVATRGISLLINMLPKMLEDMDNDKNIINDHKNIEELCQKFESKLLHKMVVADDVVSVIIKNSTLMPSGVSLDNIIEFKKKLENISF